jgi:GT2 family glycosyltransferase
LEPELEDRLAEMEGSQRALDRRLAAIESSLTFRIARAVGRPVLDWKAKAEYAIRYRLPPNPAGAWLERRDAESYRQWLTRTAAHEALSDPAAQSGPLFTLILRTAGSERKWLRSAIEAVINQTWQHWELLIPQGAELEAGELLADRRIRVAAENETGSGNYTGILDAHILLAPRALCEVAGMLAQGDADIVYSDSDHLDEKGQPEKPIFRPGWSPDLADSPLYPGAFCLRRAGTDTPIAGLHVPRVLYHSRLADTGTPKRCAPLRAAGDPLASIVICSRTPHLLDRCLGSIAAKTDWARREVIVVHHLGGDDASMERVARAAGVRRLPFEGAFNFALMNNLGARAAQGEVLIFLNDDVAPLTPGWLESLIAQTQRSGVGIAGAKLLYPSGLIQHAGVAFGIGDGCGHPGRNTRGSPWFPWLDQTRDVSAVTGACLAVRKSVFEELSGFDPLFPVNYNDVDLCLRAREAGYRVIYDSAAVLRHDECRTRRPGTEFDERRLFSRRWGGLMAAGDPFYNPNLTSVREDAGL